MASECCVACCEFQHVVIQGKILVTYAVSLALAVQAQDVLRSTFARTTLAWYRFWHPCLLWQYERQGVIDHRAFLIKRTQHPSIAILKFETGVGFIAVIG